MANEVLAVIVRVGVVGTLGILLMMLLREPARRAVGAEAAYWLWLILAGSLMAVFLPRAPVGVCRPETLLGPFLTRGIGAPLDLAPSIAVNSCALPVILTRGLGVTVALTCCLY